MAEGELLAPAVWYNARFIDYFVDGLKIRTKSFTPPTGKGSVLDFVVSAIKLCSICLDTCRKVSDGLVVGALDGHLLDIQQLNRYIVFLSGSGFLNRLENAVSTWILIYGEEGFGAGVHDLE